MKDPNSDEGQKRVGGWFLAFISAAILLFGGIIVFGLSKLLPKSDIDVAASHLDEDVAAAKVAGVPLVAADLHPNPPVKDSENAAPIILAAIRKYKAVMASRSRSGSARPDDLAPALALAKK